MKDIARLSIERPLYSWMLTIACIVGGLIGIDTVGRLEDPPFPLMFVYVITP
jgi:multidrug efflux pump subunit AcrB